MRFYELIFIVRQDVSSADVDKVIDDFTKLINDQNGAVVKTEYWGLRTLAYEINNNKKGHYVFMGLHADNSVVVEVERKLKLNENVIRFLTIKVDKIDETPSPILKEKQQVDTENTIDVTA